MKVIYILTALVVLTAGQSTATNNNRDEWVDPHAWQRSTTLEAVPSSNPKGSESCPPCPAVKSDTTTTTKKSQTSSGRATENHGEFLYRKLVNFMINEKRMKFDTASERFHRTLHIQLTRDQYERVRNGEQDLRDIDGVLQDIWHQSKQGTLERMHESIWSFNEYVQHVWHVLVNNRLYVTAVKFGAVVLVYLWAKQRKMNVALIAFAAIAFYVYRYLDSECHRKLEIERLADLVNLNEPNPCQGEGDNSWYSYFFGRGRREECKQYLESREEKTCSLKDIYEAFLDEFVFGLMSMFIEAFAKISAKMKTTYGYFGMIAVLLITYLNMGFLIESIFKYVIGPLISNVRRQPPVESNQQRLQGDPHPQGTISDNLSGPIIERLLTITESTTKLAHSLTEKLQPPPKFPDSSGVEILPIEDKCLALLEVPSGIRSRSETRSRSKSPCLRSRSKSRARSQSRSRSRSRKPQPGPSSLEPLNLEPSNLPLTVCIQVQRTDCSSSSSVQSLPLPDSGASSKGPCSSKASSVLDESDVASTSTDESDTPRPVDVDDWHGDTASDDDIVILEHFEETRKHKSPTKQGRSA